jgi:hypothetical protein
MSGDETMGKRVQVRLLSRWLQMANPEGPASFIRSDLDEPAVLQVSLFAEYKSGPAPNPTVADLIELAEGLGKRHDACEVVESFGGECELGRFGSVVFHSAEYPRTQFWYLSNGFDFVLASLLCSKVPEPHELSEASEIVLALTLSSR